jgi:uncharacterized membrane protein
MPDRDREIPTQRRQKSMSTPEPATSATIQEMVELEARDRLRTSVSDRIANWISAFAGSMLFVWLHIAWFAAWILLNTSFVGWRFDAFPFGLLTMIVSLEAIFLSTFVLISQNRLSLFADKRSKLDLQVNLISELEVTKVMSLLSDIHQHLGLSKVEDVELQHMQEPTHVAKLADAVDAAEEEAGEKSGAAPKSPVGTQS